MWPYLLGPRYVNFFEPFHFFTAVDQLVVPIWGIAHFFTATRNTIEGAGEKREQMNKTNKMFGLTQVQKGSYVTLCMCRPTLAWVTGENSTTLLECRFIFPHYGWTLSHADSSLCCPVATASLRRPSPTASSSSFFQLSSRVPLPLPVTPRSQVPNPLSGFAPKQKKELSAWRNTNIVLHRVCSSFFFKFLWIVWCHPCTLGDWSFLVINKVCIRLFIFLVFA